ncbi:MAG TPA: glycosyltransferase [Alteraurantiacibacter sp.]
MTSDNSSLLVCDLTQSYSPRGGGGISTYLREKRCHVLARTNHRLLQIVPGPEDKIVDNGQHIWVEVGADPVRGSPNYRFILRTKKVREVLARYRPDLIESLCPWILPWTAINHRRSNPECALVAGYRTDFPNAHVYRVAQDMFGGMVAKAAKWLIMGYAEITYREFDRIYTLGEESRAMLATRKIDRVDVLDLGVDAGLFDPTRRDPAYRKKLGLPGEGPLLIYAGRIDNEKRADRLVELMRRLPPDLGAALVMLGDGKLRQQLIEQARGLPVAFPGFLRDRNELASALASADIYVSAMADETFGISIVEAQASGLPVVGVASGAMTERVPEGLGVLGPVDDIDTMAHNVLSVWNGRPKCMGRAARAHVANRYSWERTFQRLFCEVYPAAIRRAEERVKYRRGNSPNIGEAAEQPA